MLKKILYLLLKMKAQTFIEKFHPYIIGVTGSVGKTTNRLMIAHFLSAEKSVRSSEENYNNEIGFPLSILGEVSPGSSFLGWIKILFKKHLSCPEILVLEYGIDHPNDMDYLLEIAKPNITVFTGISSVHEEFFSDETSLIEEKKKLLVSNKHNGMIFYFSDDEKSKEILNTIFVQKTGIGFGDNQDVSVFGYGIQTSLDDEFTDSDLFVKTYSRIQLKNTSLDIVLKNKMGKDLMKSIAVSFAIAEYLGLDIKKILDQKIEKLPIFKGRMELLPGIKGSLILDGSYNAAFSSMKNALETLVSFTPPVGSRRIALLGHMAEIGKRSESQHEELGELISLLPIDLCLIVGSFAKPLYEKVKSVHESIYFEDSNEAGRYMDKNLKTGDIVLVKGSQSARMEKAVKDIMLHPENASHLLVRQSEKWVSS